jgi:tRNA nucleotidyltransferase/poly(A) polymerase
MNGTVFENICQMALKTWMQQSETSVYWIGGVPRDQVLGVHALSLDFDLTVVGNAIDAAHELCAFDSRFQVINTFPDFATAQVTFTDRHPEAGSSGSVSVDLASTRTETYAICGALPTVTHVGVSLLEDAYRRDFTLNTLALDAHGNLIDPTGRGLADCQARRLEVTYDTSFQDDPTRILRGFGLASRLNLTFSPHTEALIQAFLEQSPSLYSGGGDRVRTALLKWFQAPESSQKHHLMSRWLEWGGLSLWDARLFQDERHPFAPEWYETLLVFDQSHLLMPAHRAMIYWLSLLVQTPRVRHEGLLEKLEARRKERQAFEGLRNLLSGTFDAPLEQAWTSALTPLNKPEAIVSLIEQVPFAAFLSWLTLMPLEHRMPDWQTVWPMVLERYLKEWASVESPLSPRALMAAGIPQGSEISSAQSALRQAKLRGEISSASEALVWLNHYGLEPF